MYIHTYVVIGSVNEFCCRCQPLIVCICRLFGNIVGGAQLNICLLEIIFDTLWSFMSSYMGAEDAVRSQD